MTPAEWMCVYLWSCLEYVREHYPLAWAECGADQHETEYKELLNAKAPRGSTPWQVAQWHLKQARNG